jgi:signal transduction histidine kinase
VAGSRTEALAERPDGLLRFSEPWLQPVLGGAVAQHWGQDLDNAEVRNSVAVPVLLAGQVRGAVVMESVSDGLALVTNRAVARLLLTTLALMLLMAAGLWLFASRLSRRVQRLSGAVSAAMDNAAHPPALPLTEDKDELGELARNNARLLRAVADYTGYLQKLAGRLSHELKTPLAITRSSLENLASREQEPEAQRYLARAREGVERQAAIIRAMSEASRLEAAVQSADWEVVDLAALLEDCVAGYRSLHEGRVIGLALPQGPQRCRCIPDLLVQALDKLVDNAISLTTPADEVAIGLEPKGNYFHIKVRNSGTRLPETLKDQLFDSLVSVREPGHGGMHLGLGLHIVRLVAQAHGGGAEAHNEEASNQRPAAVVFTISIPASQGV